MKKKIGNVFFRKNFWVERDLNPVPNDSDASSLWTELYMHTLFSNIIIIKEKNFITTRLLFIIIIFTFYLIFSDVANKM